MGVLTYTTCANLELRPGLTDVVLANLPEGANLDSDNPRRKAGEKSAGRKRKIDFEEVVKELKKARLK